MKRLLPLILFLLTHVAFTQTQPKREVVGRDIGQLKNIKISGRIMDEITGEALVGATVTVPELNITRITDSNGGFELVLDRAEYILEFRYVGYETIKDRVQQAGVEELVKKVVKETLLGTDESDASSAVSGLTMISSMDASALAENDMLNVSNRVDILIAEKSTQKLDAKKLPKVTPSGTQKWLK